jgi:hypothetical protein
MKIPPVEADLLHVKEQTDWRTERRDEANNRLEQFSESA